MHTFNTQHNVRFHHNGDFSGDVRIVKDGVHSGDGSDAVSRSYAMEIPMSVIVALVAELVRRDRIRRLETMSDNELLGIDSDNR